MRPVTRRSGVRGFTLVELTIALVLGMVVLGAASQVLVATRRFLRLQVSMLEVHQNLRAAVQVLSAELRELDAADGDIVAMGADSISIRATRGVAFACAPGDPATGRIVVRSALRSGYRDIDPARDRVLVFRDGDPRDVDDDAWLDLGISAAGGAATCPDGATASELRLTGAIGGLDSVQTGAPVRWYERDVYRLYADETGNWWLGVRGWSAGAWAPLSPIAGPLRPRLGLQLAYYDAAGVATADSRRVARIELKVRGIGSALLQEGRGVQRRWADSLAAVVVPRNSPR